MHDRSDRGAPARPPAPAGRRPPLAVLVAMLALTLAVAACTGSGNPTASSNASDNQDRRQRALNFAKCLRQHGIDMPDPQFTADGGIEQRLPAGVSESNPRYTAAQRACQTPTYGGSKHPTAQQLQQLVRYARCIREQGIDMADPDANGQIAEVKGRVDRARLRAAEQACQKYMPG
jgi:hypothetical protein